ncbi:MAG: hypothetical protein QOF40_1551 [Actinomycetota bacterium]|nr:hypothetical protein [Actinomycetota bacterium]
MQTFDRDEQHAHEVSVAWVLRWTMALLMLGAAGIHFAAMGEHAGVSWTHGLFFGFTAWAQVVLAALLVLGPARRAIQATIFVNFVIIVVWVVSRTAGIAIGTDGTPEPVAFADALCTAFEALTIGLGLILVAGSVGRRRVRGSAGWAFGGCVAVVVAALTSVGFSPAVAGGSGGSTHSHGATDVAAASTAAGHVHTVAAGANAAGTTATHSHNADQLAELQPDQPLDAATRAKLAEELVTARAIAAQFPTVAEATAAGMIPAGTFSPGVGAHYVRLRAAGDILPNGEVNPANPGSLIFDGNSPTSHLVGLMYLSGAETPPEGFAGPNDHWHRHSNTCVIFAAGGIQVPFAADSDVTKAMCAAKGGTFMERTTWMVHAWVVPGWESPQGVFSHANPNLHCADGSDNADKAGFCAGT